MHNPPRPTIGQESEGLLTLATVIGHLDQTKRRVRLSKVPGGEEIWAEVALASAPSRGDRVLVAKDDGMRHYVIGVLQAADASPSLGDRVVARDGSSAERVAEDGEERLRLLDRRGRLLFEYRPDSGTAVVNVPDGDLQFRAPGGNIDLISGRSLRLAACNRLDMTAMGDVRLAAGGERGGEDSDLRIARDGVTLASKRLKVRAAQGDMVVETARYRGRRLDASVSRARLVFARLESIAERVVTRAQSLYQTVEQLHYTCAGRVRTLVEGTYDVNGRRLRLKGKDMVKIDGDKIHLG
jgi:hypothetical protein